MEVSKKTYAPCGLSDVPPDLVAFDAIKLIASKGLQLGEVNLSLFPASPKNFLPFLLFKLVTFSNIFLTCVDASFDSKAPNTFVISLFTNAGDTSFKTYASFFSDLTLAVIS